MRHEHFTQVALITGAAKRVGAIIAQYLHQKGFRIVLHYNHSKTEAENLAAILNAKNPNTVKVMQGSLANSKSANVIVQNAAAYWDRLDIVINNAANYYPTPIGQTNEMQWDDLLNINLKMPFFISQAAAPYLKQTRGNIINIVDIKAEQPAKNHTVYCITKAGLLMLTKSLAKELGPEIRVNAVAPGAILQPEQNQLTSDAYLSKLKTIPLQRIGAPKDIAKAIWFLIKNGTYITGQMIIIDGGRSLILHGDYE